MGGCCPCGPKREARVLILGTGGAGQSSVMSVLRNADVKAVKPTRGYDYACIEYGGVKLQTYDVSPSQWSPFALPSTRGIIFVVDASRPEELDSKHAIDKETAKDMLARVLMRASLRESVLLVMANKQDMKGALKVDEVIKRLGLTQLTDRVWKVQACCALTGDGVWEGLDWFSKEIRKTRKSLSTKQNLRDAY